MVGLRFAGLLAIGFTLVGCQADNPLDLGDPADCSIPEQNAFAYRLMQEAYLWRDQVPTDIDPARYDSPDALVSDLRYAELDKWSRVADLGTTDALFEEGRVLGFGIRVQRQPSNDVVLAFVEPNSPAAQAGLMRGDTVLKVGELVLDENATDEQLFEAFGPSEPGVRATFTVRGAESPAEDAREVPVAKDWYPLTTVPVATTLEVENTTFGYLLFTTFIEPSEAELDAAFTTFNAAGVREVVVDMRYNGGGRVSTARHLMNLLVGAAAAGEVGYRTEYTPALAEADSTHALEPVDASVPQLDHVTFLVTQSAASASELVINAVLPYAEVSVVGEATAGKPVGSAQFEFCDKAAHPITFRLLNGLGQGDYFDGIQPTCAVPDDVARPLGDAQESLLQTALYMRTHEGACPPAPEAAAVRVPNRPLRRAPAQRMRYRGIEALVELE